MMKPKVIIGLDPDLHDSGMAVFVDKDFTNIGTCKIWKLFLMLKEMNDRLKAEGVAEFIVLLEYPDNTNTYHAGGKGAALNVGKNQAVAIIIKEFMDSCKINYKLLKPKGYSNFFKDANFFKLQTGWKERANSDARAAAAMVWLNK